MEQVTRDEPGALSPNQIVAYNLRRARGERGWTQEEAARQLRPYLGVEWRGPQFSVAERWNPKEGQKVRRFDAEDLVAFALAFERPVGFFLMPPDAAASVALPGCDVEVPALLFALADSAPAEEVVARMDSAIAGFEDDLAKVRLQLKKFQEWREQVETEGGK